MTCWPSSGDAAYVDLGCSSPSDPLDLQRLHLCTGDEAAVNGLDVVGAMPTEAHTPVPVDGKPHMGPPSQSVGCARNLLHGDLEIGAGDAPKLLGDEVGLQSPLGTKVDVLPITATATTRSGVATRWLHPVGGGIEDLDRIGPEKGGRLRSDQRHHPFTGECVADEHDASVFGPGDATAAGGDRTSVQFDERHDPLIVGRN